MPIFTKNGDNGNTFLLGNIPASKADIVFEVLGTLDELNSILGLVLTKTHFTKEAQKVVIDIQKDLFRLGSVIANPSAVKEDYDWLSPKVEIFESLILDLENNLPKLTNFILPGGTEQGALLHYSRTVCRRLERCLVVYSNSLLPDKAGNFSVGKESIMYINRLSDFLFCLARAVNLSLGCTENKWSLEK